MNIEDGNGECNVFLTSDHHFGHDNIRGYCNRPFSSVWEMDKILIDNWNAIVKPEDIIYYLGDFSFQSDKYRKHLNGKKFCLVRGNHDKKRYDFLFDEVIDSMELKIGEFNCYLTHQPIELDRHYKKGFIPDFSAIEKKNYSYYLVGHVHEAWKVKGKNVNMGVDVWDMKPVHINDLIIFLRGLKENSK